MTLEVILIVDEPQQTEIFLEWAEENGLDVDALSNSGCGCCVDIIFEKSELKSVNTSA